MMGLGVDLEMGTVVDARDTGKCYDWKRYLGCGSACGRDYFDWSHVLLGMGLGLSGGGVFTGYLIPEPYVVAGSVAFFAVTTFLGCCRISCLKPVKNMEGQLKDYRSLNLGLHDENIRLSENAKNLRKTKKKLKAASDKAKKTVENLKKTLGENVNDLSDVSDKLKKTVEKLNVVEDLFDKYRTETRKVAKKINKFNRSQKVFKKNVGEFSGEVKRLEVHKVELHKAIEEFDDVERFRSQQMEQLALISKGLEGDIFLFQEQFQALSDELKEFSANTHKLDVEEDEYEASVKNVEELGKTLMDKAEELANEYKDLKSSGNSE